MPEKTINEVSRAWRDLFEKGSAALARQNFDYAIDIFNQILQKEPAFYDCRASLRAAQYKRAAGARQGFFKKAFGKASFGPLLAKGQIVVRSNPVEALSIAEQILNSDPSSTMAHKLLADAALAADLPKTAVLSLEILFKNAANDTPLAMKLGEALVLAGQIARAERIYIDLLRADPQNIEISQALKNLSARRTMKESGYGALADGEGSYRDILKDKNEAVALEQEQREVKTEDVAQHLIGEYAARLLKEPDNLKLMRSLAELHAQKQEFDQALEYYARIAAADVGNDPSLDQAMAATTLKKLDYTQSQLDRQAPDYAEQAARLKAQRDEYQVAECKQRVERYPNDLQIRFEMGQIYFQLGRISEAIQEFQKAQANPHRKIQTMNYLGQCFARRNMNDLAARTFQTAIKEKIVFDEEKKELIYALGCVLEKMGKKEEAIEQFKLIYEVDIGYKDIGAKVDAYYASQG